MGLSFWPIFRSGNKFPFTHTRCVAAERTRWKKSKFAGRSRRKQENFKQNGTIKPATNYFYKGEVEIWTGTVWHGVRGRTLQ